MNKATLISGLVSFWTVNNDGVVALMWDWKITRLNPQKSQKREATHRKSSPMEDREWLTQFRWRLDVVGIRPFLDFWLWQVHPAMGNVSSSSRGAGVGALVGNGAQKSDATSTSIDNSPLAFHSVHGENIRWAFNINTHLTWNGFIQSWWPHKSRPF